MALHVHTIDSMPLFAAKAAASRGGIDIDGKFSSVDSTLESIQSDLSTKTTEMTAAQVEELLGSLS